jgi:glycerophosphoryl diester phosphodiesterase
MNALRTTTLFLGMLSILSFLACKARHTQPVAAPVGFDWQGHRGCRGLLPENTVAAFVHALEYPEVRTLELDLAVSSDGQLIVSHEPWFNADICRLPNGDSIRKKEEQQYLIYQLTAAEIRQFDCGSMGNPRFKNQQKQAAYKPTLREVVEAVRVAAPNRDLWWNIEIKSEPAYDGTKTPPITEFVALVEREVRALGIAQRCNIQSFDVRPLQILHRTAPDLPLSLLVGNPRSVAHNLDQLGFTPQIYSPYYLTVSRKTVRRCHQKGMKIIPWTVNDVPAMRHLLHLGVDGIITDYPNLIRSVGEKGER